MPDEHEGEKPREKEIFKDYHVLLIGISRYREQDRIDWTLNKIHDADRDAQSVRETLEAIGYPPSQIHCLFNEEATLEAIRRKLIDLATIWRIRLLFIFWAGHGVSDSQGSCFLVCHDTNLSDLDLTALPVDEVIQKVQHANAPRKSVFLDTCYSSPEHAQIFRIKWSTLDLTNGQHALAFVGASTYLALAQAGTGGILASCLKEALSDRQTLLCDPADGTVHLADVVGYLQRHMRPRAREAWIRAGKWGDVPQHPYVFFLPGHNVPVGRNMPVYIRTFIEPQLPDSVGKLASMITSKEPFR